MYNSIDRTALFTALHERPKFQSYIYGRPARVFLTRGDGEFTVPRVWLHDLDDEDSTRAGEGADAGDADGALFIEITDDKTRDDENI
jgi:hypothetical protein